MPRERSVVTRGKDAPASPETRSRITRPLDGKMVGGRHHGKRIVAEAGGGVVGMRSCASGVAFPETVPALYAYARVFVRFVHCSMNARRRTRGSASLPRHARAGP